MVGPSLSEVWGKNARYEERESKVSCFFKAVSATNEWINKLNRKARREEVRNDRAPTHTNNVFVLQLRMSPARQEKSII